MHDDSQEQVEPDTGETLLPKVADIPVADLIRSEDSAFARALQRLARDNDLRNDHYAAHSSTP